MSKSKWINVQDRLPENGEDVLAFDENFGLSIAWHEDELGIWKSHEIGLLLYVTHWMKLPKAPKGEGYND